MRTQQKYDIVMNSEVLKMKRDFIGDAVFDFNKVLKVAIENEFSVLQIGVGQLQILMRLYEKPDGYYRQSDLVESLGIDKSNASRNVSKLMEKDLVEIIQINKRDKGIKLTETSKQYKQKIMGSLQNISIEMIKGISEEELRITFQTLIKMKENLQ